VKRFSVLVFLAVAALAYAASASAHAHVSPPVVISGESQLFTVLVPTEKENATTTTIELTPPDGFSIGSLVPTPGWTYNVDQEGSGEDAVVKKVTWSGGDVPAGAAAALQFTGSADSNKTYAFGVRQTYSDGSIVDWSGPAGSDEPAPTIEAKASLGGGSGSSTVSWIAVAVAALARVVALAGLATGTGRRNLT
jgi:uncharacterized protein YcnI